MILDDLREQAEVGRRHPCWQIYRSPNDRHVRPDVPVLKGQWWAAHFEYERPCVVADTLEALDAELAIVDQVRIEEARATVNARFPAWKLRYLDRPTRVRGRRLDTGDFCATKSPGWSWLHVADGQTADALCRRIAECEQDLRELPLTACLRIPFLRD